MKAKAKKLNLIDGIFYALIILIVVFITLELLRSAELLNIKVDLTWLKSLNTVFQSILIQAIPFVLIGIFVSSVLKVFVSDEMLIKLFPQKRGIGFLTAVVAGLFFPVCDCAIVPIATRLIKKGVSVPIAVVFMLCAPIMNPIVIFSTFFAFPGQPKIAVFRVAFGIIIALTIGLFLSIFPQENILLSKTKKEHLNSCEHCSSSCDKEKKTAKNVAEVFRAAGEEFFEVVKYLIIGAFISSLFQVVIPKSFFGEISKSSIFPLLIMMLAAFVFSVCSTSDAFIARTFLGQFSINSVMGFLVLGPMIDIKNMLMLLSSFRKGFVLKLVALIIVTVFLMLIFLTKIFM